MRAMRAFADQHDPRVADDLLERFQRGHTPGRVNSDTLDHLCRCFRDSDSGGSDTCGRSGKEFTDLFVADLTEVPERLPHCEKGCGHRCAHDIVDDARELPAG